MRSANFFVVAMFLIAGVLSLEGSGKAVAEKILPLGKALVGSGALNSFVPSDFIKSQQGFNSSNSVGGQPKLSSASSVKYMSFTRGVGDQSNPLIGQVSNQGLSSVSVEPINTTAPVRVDGKLVNVKATRVTNVENQATKNLSGIDFSAIVTSTKAENDVPQLEENSSGSVFENVDDYVPTAYEKSQAAQLAENARIAEQARQEEARFVEEAGIAKEKQVLETSQEEIAQQAKLKKVQLNQEINQRGLAVAQSPQADNLGLTNFTTPYQPVRPNRQPQSPVASQGEAANNDASPSDLNDYKIEKKPEAYQFKASELRNNSAGFQNNTTSVYAEMPTRRSAKFQAQPEVSSLDLAQSNDSSSINLSVSDLQVPASNSNDFTPSSSGGKSNGSKQSQFFSTSAAMSEPLPILQENMSQAQPSSSSSPVISNSNELPITQFNKSRAINNNKSLVVAQPQRIGRSMQESTPVQTLDLASTQQGAPDMSKYDESLQQGSLYGLFRQKPAPNYDRAVEASNLQNLFGEEAAPSQPALSQPEMYQQSLRDYANGRFGASSQASNNSYDSRNAVQPKDPWQGQSNRFGTVSRSVAPENIKPVDNNPVVRQVVADAAQKIVKINESTVVADIPNNLAVKNQNSRFSSIKNSLVTVKNKFLSIFGFADQTISPEQSASVDSAVSDAAQELVQAPQSNYSQVISDFLSQIWNILTLKSWRSGSPTQLSQSSEVV